MGNVHLRLSVTLGRSHCPPYRWHKTQKIKSAIKKGSEWMNDSSYHTEYTYITHVFTLSMFMQLQMWMAHNWLRLLSVLLVHNLLLNYSCTKSETCGLNLPTELCGARLWSEASLGKLQTAWSLIILIKDVVCPIFAILITDTWRRREMGALRRPGGI